MFNWLEKLAAANPLFNVMLRKTVAENRAIPSILSILKTQGLGALTMRQQAQLKPLTNYLATISMKGKSLGPAVAKPAETLAEAGRRAALGVDPARMAIYNARKAAHRAGGVRFYKSPNLPKPMELPAVPGAGINLP